MTDTGVTKAMQPLELNYITEKTFWVPQTVYNLRLYCNVSQTSLIFSKHNYAMYYDIKTGNTIQ